MLRTPVIGRLVRPLLAAIVWITASDVATAAPELLRIRYSSSAERTRIVADLSEIPVFEVYATEDSSRLLVDLLDVRALSTAKSVAIGDVLVDEVVLHNVEEAGVQLEIRLTSPRRNHVFTVNPEGTRAARVVIDVLPAAAGRMQDPSRAETAPSPKSKPPTHEERGPRAAPAETQTPNATFGAALTPTKEPEPVAPAPPLPTPPARRVIVLDPGHGGDDPGASGLGGLVEKDVTLRAATEIRRALERTDPTLVVLLTRNEDMLVPLRARYRFAEAQEADLFVSLHTNAASDRRARGAEVFFLSLNPTADEEANRLAELENSADLVAGVPLETGTDLLNILADLQLKDTLTRSSIAADSILSSLGRHQLLKTRSVDQASFVVLRSAKVPSVLVELGFLTNAQDAGLLGQDQFYDQLARALSEGIATYLKTAPSPSPGGVRAGS